MVDGIAHYGNAFGVATVGGEVVIDEAYNLNPLVNAFALGIVRADQIFFGKATGVGNPVLYVGAKTGRDGIHGATMASAEFDDAALAKRPTVQVGDPFLEKLLLEACLEAMRSGAIAGIQDMGAAGLTSSSCEMAARAGTGLEIDLTLVPQRETGMTAYEMLLSESQERMLIVAHAGREREVVEVFNKWDLDAVVIGHVREGERIIIKHNGAIVADLPINALTDEAPRYQRPMARRKSKGESQKSKAESQKSQPINYPPSGAALRLLLASPNIASKEWVYRQYDHMVRTNTAVLPGADAAVVRIKETRRALAMCLDGNGRYCAVNPRGGAELMVAEAARNVVCVGAQPIAVTNCLNFASPERPEVMWDFSEVVDGIATACRALETPVVSGNVSFYNETEGRGILPTPVIGMVGLLDDVRRVVTQGFKDEGDVIVLLGTTGDDLSVSEYAAQIGRQTTADMAETGRLPQVDWQRERAVQQVCRQAADARLLKAAHDCSDGGLAVALVEMCFSSHNRAATGATVTLPESALDWDVQLFAETPSRIIVSCAPDVWPQLQQLAQAADCPATLLGYTGGAQLSVANHDGERRLDESLAELEQIWRGSLAQQLARTPV